DLGSGGGLDVFLAAQKVGPTGRAIGIDMTPDMITLAQRNAQQGPDGKPYVNVDFKLGTIDQLPLPDASVDVIISNCVINLATDKSAVFAEMFRVLKPGGRVAVSDIALKDELPRELAENVAALVGCIAGAIPIEAFEAGLRSAGFDEVAVVDAQSDLTAYANVEGQAGCCAPASGDASSGCCSPATESLHQDLGDLFERYDVNAYAASVKVFAIKR
ncbi:MAG: methyltransferase domain-containing protein, partial [Planctomycetota bacterium]